MDEDLGEIRHAARWVYRRDATLRRQFVSDYTRLQRRSLVRRQQQARQQKEQEQQGGGSDTPHPLILSALSPILDRAQAILDALRPILCGRGAIL